MQIYIYIYIYINNNKYIPILYINKYINKQLYIYTYINNDWNTNRRPNKRS